MRYLIELIKQIIKALSAKSPIEYKKIEEVDDDWLTFHKQNGEQITKDFHSSEFYCHCGNCDPQLVFKPHIELLQKLRDRLGKPIFVTSGYRCARHNRRVGGVDNSQHKNGCATDIQCKNLNKAYKIAKELGFKGIGRYNTFIHLDSRIGFNLAFWDERKDKK